MPKVVPDYKKQAVDTIIDSASKLFFELGYSTTSMDEIAAKIGVTKGTIYLYFKSKDEVLYEVCNRNMKMLQEMLKDVKPDDFLDMGTTFFETEMKMPDHIKFHWIFALGKMNSNPQVRKILLDSYREYVNLLASKIEQLKTDGRIFENTDSLNLARLLVAFHNGIMMSVMQGLPENLALSLFKVGMAALLQNPYKAVG
jgi:AcrR family transcriptional regulator